MVYLAVRILLLFPQVFFFAASCILVYALCIYTKNKARLKKSNCGLEKCTYRSYSSNIHCIPVAMGENKIRYVEKGILISLNLVAIKFYSILYEDLIAIEKRKICIETCRGVNL